MTRRFSIRIGQQKSQVLELARNRLMVAVFLFAASFLFLGARTIDLGLMQGMDLRSTHNHGVGNLLPQRADIVDRNGVLLATNLETASVYADPKRVIDPVDAARKLARVLPGLSQTDLEAKLTSSRRFVWIRRKLTPKELWKVNALGIPGVSFQMEEERLYPKGRLAAHVLGHVDIDGRGLAGIERFFDDRLADPAHVSESLRLSLDIRVQHALADELSRAVARFDAKGAAGIVMDVRSGEVLAMASLPDFDPNLPGMAPDSARFNRATSAVYELGSGFKTFTIALGLESGTVGMTDGYDATDPIRIARYTIRDNHPQKRYLTVPEIFVHSSNIGAAKLAMDIGRDTQRAFLANLGMLRPAAIELSEIGYPIFPDRWGDVHTMTISYGHGIAVSPLHLASGIAAMVNGGLLNAATLVAQPDRAVSAGKPVVSAATSDRMRQLMRLAVTRGTGSQADVPGYQVGGKTGTAEKSVAGGYRKDVRISSFVGAFPMDDPQYLVLAVVDEPKGIADTQNFAGGGWVSAPVVRNVIARIAPILSVEPRDEDEGYYRRAALLVKPGE